MKILTKILHWISPDYLLLKFKYNSLPPQSNYFYSDYVLIVVKCDNGCKYIEVDRYNYLTKQWDKTKLVEGKKVVRWASLNNRR